MKVNFTTAQLRMLPLGHQDDLRLFLIQAGHKHNLDLIQGLAFQWTPGRASVNVRQAVTDPPASDPHLTARIYTYEFSDPEAIPQWVRATGS